jgi:hypothetical protein
MSSFIDTPVTEITPENWLPGNYSIPPTTVEILRACGLSGLPLGDIYAPEGYWAKMGDQSLDSFGMYAPSQFSILLTSSSRGVLSIPLRMGFCSDLHSLYSQTSSNYLLLHQLSVTCENLAERVCKSEIGGSVPRVVSGFTSYKL